MASRDQEHNPPPSPLTPTPAGETRTAVSRLRLLDFDDLFLLSHLLEGHTIAATAKQLGLTQPAITQRVRKIERVFAEPILEKVGRHVRLTKEGRAVCLRATDALQLMRDAAAEPSSAALMLGATYGAADARLLPVLETLRASDPDALYHCQLGTSDELLAALEAGALDACLTAALPPSGRFHVTDVVEEDYVLVASPVVAATIATPDDLQRQLLLEIDRSYPSLQRLDAAGRTAARFQRAWFLGSQRNVLAAALAGDGVAILPRGLVEPGLAGRKLCQVVPELEIAAEVLRLVARADRATEPLISRLVARLAPRAR
jgi:DNA-binding transcriptional LysR family regulator